MSFVAPVIAAEARYAAGSDEVATSSSPSTLHKVRPGTLRQRSATTLPSTVGMVARWRTRAREKTRVDLASVGMAARLSSRAHRLNEMRGARLEALPGSARTLESERSPAAVPAADDPTDVMVMFLRRKYLAHESEGAVTIDVIRLGDTAARSTVLISTHGIEHHSAVASAGSDDYIPIKRQQIVFEPGETLQSVKIQLVNNDRCACKRPSSAVSLSPVTQQSWPEPPRSLATHPMHGWLGLAGGRRLSCSVSFSRVLRLLGLGRSPRRSSRSLTMTSIRVGLRLPGGR
jgi:hypothetical protein